MQPNSKYINFILLTFRHIVAVIKDTYLLTGIQYPKWYNHKNRTKQEIFMYRITVSNAANDSTEHQQLHVP